MSKDKTAAKNLPGLGDTNSETKPEPRMSPPGSPVDPRPAGVDRGDPDLAPEETADTSPAENEQAALERLKGILLDSERAAIDQLRDDLANNRLEVGRLSEMLPLAIRKAAAHDEKLAAALGPTMANSFHDSVKRNPKALADAISPIMGPAIRRAITQAISGMMQSLNQTIEHSFSWNGLKWRWQAWTTNRPFAEVVLLNAFEYRVEQIFLIHRNDGALLAHATNAKAGGASADLVSAMLTAIQDFVRDSFGAAENESIESMQIGSSHVWVIPSPHAVLAVVIRGVPPKEMRRKLQAELESIHADYSEALADYDGDNTPFEIVVPQLEACLFSKTHSFSSSQPSWLRRVLLVGILLLPLLLAGWLVHWSLDRLRSNRAVARVHSSLRVPATVELTYDDGHVVASGRARDAWIERARQLVGVLPEMASIDLKAVENIDQPWHDYLRALRAEPGMVVWESSISEDGYVVRGLRDPLAADPQQLAEQFPLAAAEVVADFQPYDSKHPPFVMARVQQGFPPHSSVRWTADDQRLTARGSASHAWLVAALRFADSLGETIEVDLSQVRDGDALALQAAAAALDGRTILFASDKFQLTVRQQGKIEQLAADVKQVQQLAERAETLVDVILVGYRDTEADAAGETRLARARALSVWQALEAAGVRTEGLFVRQGGSFASSDNTEDGRRCTVLVRIRDK